MYSLIAGVAIISGTLLVFRHAKWAQKNSLLLISFATGTMLTIAFTHLIPEAGELTTNVWGMTFAGFLAFYVLQNILSFHPCHEEECEVHGFHGLQTISTVGITIHSFMDGVAIAAGFEASWSLGILTTLAVLLHKVPEGITITCILMHTGMEQKKIFLRALTVALATPTGAIISFYFLRHLPPQFLGMLLALTAGSFIYLASADLLPETHKSRHWTNAAFFFFGVVLIMTVGHLLH
jgi:ZIP family zinc transporter/zinc and cadmium transporter